MIASVPTKDKILDAAEKLFGMNGFDATSLRDITAEAQVNLAAVNYHFQTKDSLMLEDGQKLMIDFNMQRSGK